MNHSDQNIATQAFHSAVMDVNSHIEGSIRNPVLATVLKQTGRFNPTWTASDRHGLPSWNMSGIQRLLTEGGPNLSLNIREVRQAIIRHIRSPT